MTPEAKAKLEEIERLKAELLKLSAQAASDAFSVDRRITEAVKAERERCARLVRDATSYEIYQRILNPQEGGEE